MRSELAALIQDVQYRDEQKQISREMSLKEIETDLKRLQEDKNKGET